jgi:ubiquinone/menaquinone biosynthesis C-methylase UbiE
VADGSADLVISNGVINLALDKDQVFRETFRVLRPGGRLQIADIVVHRDIPPAAREDIAIWTA